MEQSLVEWKERTQRMPLLLYGARQVGKTYLLHEFGSKYFENVVYINLEINLSVASYFTDDISPKKLIRYLEASANEVITAGKTLIILDEIQSCERALTSLKYFCEEAPEYHIAAAGSLLGVAIHREQFSFPVGKVESMMLFPLDFEEFLWANGNELLAQEIREAYNTYSPLPDALHQKALELYHDYLIVGGMPSCVQLYINTQKLVMIQPLQNEIINNYVADMAKYANPSDTVKIRSCFNSIPAQLAKENRKFQYKVVQRGGSASLFGESIEWLSQASVVLKCQKITSAMNPISVYCDLSSFKLYFCDVGLLVMKSGISLQTILANEPNLFMGAISENYVAQALATNHHALYYWTSEHSVEVDFVIQKDHEIIGIEVKKGTNVRSKSLHVFSQKYQPTKAIRFSEKNFGISDTVISLPLYAAFCV